MNDFENRIEKHEVRLAVLTALRDWLLAYHKNTPEIHLRTLPGARWLFENQAYEMLNLWFGQQTFKFFCFESKQFDKVRAGFPLRLSNNTSRIGNCHFKLTDGNYEYRPFAEATPTFHWADYCGLPSAQVTEDLIRGARRGDLIFLTFSMIWRRATGVDPILLKHDKWGESDRYDAVREYYTAQIQRVTKAKPTLVTSIEYVGGRATPMLTLGFHISENSSLPQKHVELANQSREFLDLRHDKTKAVEGGVESDVKSLVKQLLLGGYHTDGYIMGKHNLTKMQLAGFKAAMARQQRKELASA